MGLGRAFATVGGLTMGSRVLGFVRDILIARYLGAGPAAEAFFVAFRLPNLFRRLFAEGAFNSAFVPLYAKRLESDPAEARDFANEAYSGLLMVLVLVTLLAQALMPWLILLLAGGFADDPQRLSLAVLYGRLEFPYLLFISLTALMSGMLNAHGRFAAAAAAPMLLNLILIAAMLLAAAMGWVVGHALAVSVSLAGLAQWWSLHRAMRKIGLRLRLQQPRLTAGVRRLVQLGLPAALAGGVVQINLVIGTQIASWFDGAVAWLSYADRLYQLPLGVVGVAIGVVLLPELSRRLRAGDGAGANAAMNRAIEFALLLTLPAALALALVPTVLCQALFERGAFTHADTIATAQALALYALGLPAFVLGKVFSPAYFAREDMKAPMRYAAWAMGVNTALSMAGVIWFGFLAIPLASTLAAWLNLWLLWRGLGGRFVMEPSLLRLLPRLVLCLLVLAAVLLGTQWLLAVAHALWQAMALVLVGMLSYGAAVVFSGAADLRQLKQALRRS